MLHYKICNEARALKTGEKMGVEKGEGCFMLKADPWGRKQTDGKGGSSNILLEEY